MYMAKESNVRKRKNRPCGDKLIKKRRETLARKAWELETLCDAKVCIVSCYDSDDGGGVDQVWPKDENKAISLIAAHRSKQAQPNKPRPNLPGDSTAELWRKLETKLLAVEEKIESLKGKSVTTTMLFSGDVAEPWSWEELMEVGDREFSFRPAGDVGANNLTELDEIFGCSEGEGIVPSSESLRYDLYLLWQGTNVSMYDNDDDVGFQYCTADGGGDNQSFISPLHEALPMSFWPQPSQLELKRMLDLDT